MRNFNENTITDAVLGRITGATDTRIREISEALVRHLHAFVREVRPTQKEWEYGIEFLTRTGHMCDDKRRNSSCCRTRSASPCWWTRSTILFRKAQRRPPCLDRSSY